MGTNVDTVVSFIHEAPRATTYERLACVGEKDVKICLVQILGYEVSECIRRVTRKTYIKNGSGDSVIAEYFGGGKDPADACSGDEEL